MEKAPHILVVDDHREIRDLVAKFLTRNGLRVTVADGGTQMRDLLARAAVDLVVLDVMMPGEDGIALCRALRADGDLPVILLTAVSGDDDRVVGLEAGADDYVTKPFNPRELLARIRAVLRRTQAGPRPVVEGEPKALRFDRFVLDPQRLSLTDEAGRAVALGTAEFRLLHAFLTRPGLVLSRDQLLDLTAGRTPQLFDRSIDNLVSRLRRRIERDPQEPALIKTVWGNGYVFAGEVEAER
ncbi:response regulator [uncultured Alsobacter sp.]|uniref:response regulator n=1 Tax=uncultured Alsobacter sp. TaxID=1748258 RepID=UPI0025E82CC8|nr:response regulator [uncultured Alsobacter sp.]